MDRSLNQYTLSRKGDTQQGKRRTRRQIRNKRIKKDIEDAKWKDDKKEGNGKEGRGRRKERKGIER